jgi:integrase/recombinase XerD
MRTSDKKASTIRFARRLGNANVFRRVRQPGDYGARPFLAQLDPDAAGRICFLNRHGRPLQPYAFRQTIHRYAAAAKLDITVTPHTFRRSCTSEMIKADANLYHVKDLLGHESFTTLKHYVLLNITDLRRTHAKCHPREKDER